jgi:YggT family protein
MNFNPFVNLLGMILSLYEWALIIYIVLGWLIYFGVVNRSQVFVAKVYEVLYRLLEPVMQYIRKVIPPISGIDLSAIVLFIAITFFKDILYTYFYRYGY